MEYKNYLFSKKVPPLEYYWLKSCGKNEFDVGGEVDMIITMFKICVLLCMAWVTLGLFLFVMWLATVFLGYLIDFIKDKFEK